MFETTRLDEIDERLGETGQLILDSGLWVHDAVDRVTLHGSRGPKGGARSDSDLDLCLVVNIGSLSSARDQGALLREVLLATLDGWKASVNLDVAAIFDKSKCGLLCLDRGDIDPELCTETVGCMGIFKLPVGFISDVGADCRLMYPLATIWSRR